MNNHYNDDIIGLLKQFPNKDECTKTTTYEFKNDIYNYFNKPEFKNKIALEVGCWMCYTTIILCKLFKFVNAINYGMSEKSLQEIESFLKKNSCFNIKIFDVDIYKNPYPIDYADIIFVDADHKYDCIVSDINNSFKLKSDNKKYLIFDDYGCEPQVKRCIDLYTKNNTIKIIKKIGRCPGDKFHRPLDDYEGTICIEL